MDIKAYDRYQLILISTNINIIHVILLLSMFTCHRIEVPYNNASYLERNTNLAICQMNITGVHVLKLKDVCHLIVVFIKYFVIKYSYLLKTETRFISIMNNSRIEMTLSIL